MRLKTLWGLGSRLAIVTIVASSFDGRAGVAIAAGPSPTSLIVFGDSLSDIGNIDDATGGVVPGSTYDAGRFSNGPAWVEGLATALGVGPLAASTAGGTNYAYGGARTSGTSFFEGGLFIDDVDEQIADYRRSRTVDPNALYVLWAGANDLFSGQTNISIPINRIRGDLQLLLNAGAREFLVPNLPILGRIPEYNRDPQASAAFDERSMAYNAQFDATLESLAAANPTATFYRLDVAEIFSDAIARPALYGLTNVTDPAAPGLEPGAAFYDEDQVVAHPEQYLFWDKIHPTATIHTRLADYATALVRGLPGDLDTDGEVDAADLNLLRAGFGATGAVRRQGDASGDGRVDGADLLVWQRGAGGTIYAPPSVVGTLAAPEPCSAVLLAIGAIGIQARAARNQPRRVRVMLPRQVHAKN